MKNLIIATVLSAAALPAFADHDVHDSSFHARQQQLEHRIHEGWRSGELTPPEHRRLRHEMRLIERSERAFMSDGRLSRGEREHLHVRLDSLAREVFHQRRDGERRYGHYNERYDTARHY
jgi:hypothetical protein